MRLVQLFRDAAHFVREPALPQVEIRMPPQPPGELHQPVCQKQTSSDQTERVGRCNGKTLDTAPVQYQKRGMRKVRFQTSTEPAKESDIICAQLTKARDDYLMFG